MGARSFVRSRLKGLAEQFTAGGRLRFDFDTWLVQIYGIRKENLDKKALRLAKKEYSEEYPEPGESEIKPKTYPLKKYLDSRKR